GEKIMLTSFVITRATAEDGRITSVTARGFKDRQEALTRFAALVGAEEVERAVLWTACPVDGLRAVAGYCRSGDEPEQVLGYGWASTATVRAVRELFAAQSGDEHTVGTSY